MADLITFRCFFEDGRSADVDAANPYDARAAVGQKHAGKIIKVKVVKEQPNGTAG